MAPSRWVWIAEFADNSAQFSAKESWDMFGELLERNFECSLSVRQSLGVCSPPVERSMLGTQVVHDKGIRMHASEQEDDQTAQVVEVTAKTSHPMVRGHLAIHEFERRVCEVTGDLKSIVRTRDVTIPRSTQVTDLRAFKAIENQNIRRF